MQASEQWIEVSARAFGALESADHEVHDAQVEELVQRYVAAAARRQRARFSLKWRAPFVLDALHELLGLLVLRRRDVRDDA